MVKSGNHHTTTYEEGCFTPCSLVSYPVPCYFRMYTGTGYTSCYYSSDHSHPHYSCSRDYQSPCWHGDTGTDSVPAPSVLPYVPGHDEWEDHLPHHLRGSQWGQWYEFCGADRGEPDKAGWSSPVSDDEFTPFYGPERGLPLQYLPEPGGDLDYCPGGRKDQ